ncbi:MAG: hypothetical protein QM607_05510 [Microbacterium sp.]
MSTMVAVQIRDVPPEVRDDLAGEARARGVSLQVLLLDVLNREAAAARNRAFLRDFTPIRGTGSSGTVDVAELIRRQREERTRQIIDSPASQDTR